LNITLTCHALVCFAAHSVFVLTCTVVQGGPVWVQIHRLLGVPEPALQLMLQRQQQQEADRQELQRLRDRVAELEQC
jgi:hypothetical protein